ncbi:MAG: amino acid transporter [Rhizobium sp.]|nr:amino acid transporter [Rhizobium sp.]
MMVGISALIALAAGIPLAVFLVLSGPGGLIHAPRANRVLAALINGFRATPFIVLLVALLPFTRFVTGTTIGVWAAVVPLSISATPFFARIAEVSLREIDSGLIEAAQAIGCRRWHIVRHVLLPEAMPGIVGGFTITIAFVTRNSPSTRRIATANGCCRGMSSTGLSRAVSGASPCRRNSAVRVSPMSRSPR